jgi:hypothetical protein
MRRSTARWRSIRRSKPATAEGRRYVQQQVVSQDTLANDQAMDVYVPGQQPPSGAAAVVRPSYSGPGSWVGFRANGAAGSDATSSISACL